MRGVGGRCDKLLQLEGHVANVGVGDDGAEPGGWGAVVAVGTAGSAWTVVRTSRTTRTSVGTSWTTGTTVRATRTAWAAGAVVRATRTVSGTAWTTRAFVRGRTSRLVELVEPGCQTRAPLFSNKSDILFLVVTSKLRSIAFVLRLDESLDQPSLLADDFLDDLHLLAVDTDIDSDASDVRTGFKETLERLDLLDVD